MAPRIHQVVQPLDIREGPSIPAGAFALMGFACDEGVRRNQGRQGAREGPKAWRKALANIPYDPKVQRPIFDLGDIICEDDNLEAAQQNLGEAVAWVLGQGAFPFVCGGGHELAWGLHQGIDKQSLNKNLAIINLDAHYDLRPLLPGGLGSSGTSFTQIANLEEQRGHPFHYACIGLQPLSNARDLHRRSEELGVLVVNAEEIEKASSKLQEYIRGKDKVLLSICLDVFAAPYAPGVSAPQPFGVVPAQVLPLLRLAAQSGKLLACCIAELSPPLDQDSRTAALAASLTIELFNNLCSL